jgi:two-component system cell cycle response regulator DivK
MIASPDSGADVDKILVVYDDPSNRKLLALLLKKDGYELRNALHAEQAIEILKTWRPHLILMDVQLPGMDGFELAGMLKASAETRDIAILAMSASITDSDIDKARAAGCDSYVEKKFDRNAFPGLVAGMIKLAKSR